jgi:hypothetical protein
MPKRCGDLAGFTFKVTSELVGKYATTLVCRQKKFNFSADHTEKLQQEETKKVKWPDLQIQGKPAGEFYGGRRVDFKGINKSDYKDKFGYQEFELNMYAGDHHKKSSGTLKIDPYADAGPEHKTIGIPMPAEMWGPQNYTNPTTGVTSVVRVLKWAGNYTSADNCGNFHIALKDGVVVITIKTQITVNGGGAARVSGRIFNKIKEAVEEFWNSRSSGYFQWVYHRDQCKRGKDCDCRVITNKKGDFLQSGCCKVPFRVVVEQGGDNPVTITLLTPAERAQLASSGYVPGLRADTKHFYYPENRAHTFAHEFGHMMGFPDQYWEGAIEAGALNAGASPAFPIDRSSIMGQDMGDAQEIHIGAAWFKSWVTSNVDQMSPIPT